MHQVVLILRGLWWRRGLAAAVLGVAVVTTTAAALGPLYARAAAESILQDHLTQAGSSAGLALAQGMDVGEPGSRAKVAQQAPPTGSIRGYDNVVPGYYTPRALTAFIDTGGRLTDEVNTHLVWKQGDCAHLHIVSGRCPSAPNEALASQRTLDGGAYNWQVGTTLTLGQITEPYSGYSPTQVPTPAPVKIVGTYRPIDTGDAFWFGQDYFDAQGITNGVDTVDSLFVDQSEFLSFAPRTYVEADFDYPLTPASVRLDNVSAERSAVEHAVTKYSGVGFAVNTNLPAVIDAANHEHHLVNVGTLLVTLQLTLLAWLVLFQVVADAVEARGNEIAMAKLRGLSPAATIRFGLGEPVVLLAAAVPIGLLLALLVTHLFAASVLVGGVPVVVTWVAVLTALVAFAGGLVAAALAGQRTLTRPVLEQWRHTNRAPGHGRLALVVDVVLAAAAIAGLVALHESHRGGTSNDTPALLAPGLLVFAVAIIGVRLLPLVCRRLARATRASRRVGLFLAARQVARRPVGLRLAAMLAVAVGLATFAVAGETVALGNRDARAGAELGANKIASVQFDASTDPVTAAQKADPDGRWAMAAATWLPDGGDSVAGTVLGVDSSRLASVGLSAAGGPSLSQIARTIGAASVPTITIAAPALRVHLTASGITGSAAPALQANLRTSRQPFLNVEGAAIANGWNTYVLPLSCASGCTLRGFTWDRPFGVDDPFAATITLTGVDIGSASTGWTPIELGLSVANSWRAATPEGQATDQVSVTTDGVRDQFTSENGGYGGIFYAYAPSPMPAISTPRSIVTGNGAPNPPQLLDSSITTAYFHVASTAPVLPAVLGDGVVLDVRYLLAELPAFVSEASWQVWLSSSAPPDAMARLHAAGFQVENVRTLSTRVSQLGRQAPALALLLLLACAIAGAVLAVGGTAISISASSRRRSYEIAALRAVGVRPRSLLWAGLAEQLLLLGTAVILGVPTGLLAARLAMPLIPEFADATPIRLTYTPHWLPVLSFAAAFVVLLSVTAWLAARSLLRLAIPARLRETEG